MKNVIIIMIALAIAQTAFAEIPMPNLHYNIMLDAKFYSGDGANEGTYDTTNRYQIRKASVAAEGELTDRVTYGVEYGISTCVGTSDQLKLMEAEVMYAVFDNIHVGIKQGHVLRGFASRTECPARLSMEKPVFQKTFGACHPLGVVAGGYFEMGDNMGLEAELALMNGANGTLDGEHDYNFGIIFETPVSGLAVTGSYNHVERQYYDESYQQYSEDGSRYGGGVNYQNYNVWATAEYFTGEGFERDDQKMNAWYTQLGYDIRIGLERLSSVQPYVMYESWDRDVDADDEQLYEYLEAGLNIKISANTMLRGAWRTNQTAPDGVVEEPESVIIRLQTGF